MSEEKHRVVQSFKAALADAHQRAQSEWDELKASLTKETKSTAGDKHETGRAMVHLEMEQAGQRLARMESMRSTMLRLDLDSVRNTVGPGALVLVQGGGFLLGVPFGGFNVPGLGKIQAISSDAPLASAMRGKASGDEVSFREKTWHLLKVV